MQQCQEDGCTDWNRDGGGGQRGGCSSEEAAKQLCFGREGVSQIDAGGSRVISGSGSNINKAQRCETACSVWRTIHSFIQGSNAVRFTFLQECLAALFLKV